MQEQWQLQFLPRSSCSQKTVSWYLFRNGCTCDFDYDFHKEEGKGGRGNEHAFPFKSSAVHAHCLQKRWVQKHLEKSPWIINLGTMWRDSLSPRLLTSLCSGESSLVHKDGAFGWSILRPKSLQENRISDCFHASCKATSLFTWPNSACDATRDTAAEHLLALLLVLCGY